MKLNESGRWKLARKKSCQQVQHANSILTYSRLRKRELLIALLIAWSAGLPEPSVAEEGLLARGNNNAEQAVRDHRRSAEDSFVHHFYRSKGGVTSEQKEEED